MTDPVQLLIDAGAIPSAPFVPQSRYNGVPLAVLQRRPDTPRQVYVRRRFIPALSTLAIAARHAVSALERPDLLGARHLGDPLLYWRIADANAVVDPNELTDTLGRRVAIPLPPGM
jgi:hypothetical protein